MNPKQRIGALISKLPGGEALVQAYRERVFRMRYAGRDAEQVFTEHYECNSWGSEESRSGPGSTLAYTESIRREIPLLIDRLSIRRILDAPCGDYNWFRLVREVRDFEYIGGDIVKPLIDRNLAAFGDARTAFVHLDITQDPLPQADLWMCRDCLFHLSEQDIFRVLANFVRSDIEYLLTTTHPLAEENRDVPTGGYRLLNLERPPYSLGKPDAALDDWIEGTPVRHLALWKRRDVAEALSKRVTGTGARKP